MKKEKFKHIFLMALAAILIGVGYLNYDYEDTIQVATESLENEGNFTSIENLGDVELVNANVVTDEEILVPNNESAISTLTSTSSDEDEYFSNSRLERENMYSQMLESYQKMINSKDITNEQKAIAIQEIDNINKIKNAIMISENLIKNKGFEDVVILVSNNTASVIVKSGTLTAEQVAQIQNIVCKQLNFDAVNITISEKK